MNRQTERLLRAEQDINNNNNHNNNNNLTTNMQLHILQRMNQQAERSLRAEQDAEYERAMAADREAAATAAAVAVAATEAAAAAADVERQAVAAAAATVLAAEQAAAHRVALRATLPPQPAAKDDDVVNVCVRTPSGAKETRRFNEETAMSVVFTFIGSIDVRDRDGNAVAIADRRIASAFPRRVHTDGTASLSSLGLGTQILLVVEDAGAVRRASEMAPVNVRSGGDAEDDDDDDVDIIDDSDDDDVDIIDE
jgi:hypothetical protein